MTLPTVVAREPDRYSAAVIVGGGADFWLMNERSNYKGMIDAVRVKWDGEPPTDQVRARFDELYLQHAPLDSYHTAAVLKGKKVLLIQGTKDLAVPSPLGDLLWERMGKPERWLEEGLGHELLFMALPQKFGKMMEWLGDVKYGAERRERGIQRTPESPAYRISLMSAPTTSRRGKHRRLWPCNWRREL